MTATVGARQLDIAERGPTAGDPSSARSLHHVTVVTPEGVVLDFRAAGVGSRILAKGIDLVIQFVALLAALLVAGIMIAAVGEAVGVIVIIVTIFLVFYGYGALLETFFGGRTIGKAVLKIRVITTEGAPVGFRHSAIRSMLATFDFWVPTPGGLVALFAALLTARSQRLGDLAAGTIVVRESKSRIAPVQFPPPFGLEGFVAVLDTSRLDSHQYTVVREYLLRLKDLSPEAAHALGERLTALLEQAVGVARPPGMTATHYLMCVTCAHQRRGVGMGGPPPPPTAYAATAGPPPAPQQSPPHRPPPSSALRHLPPPSGPPVR